MPACIVSMMLCNMQRPGSAMIRSSGTEGSEGTEEEVGEEDGEEGDEKD